MCIADKQLDAEAELMTKDHSIKRRPVVSNGILFGSLSVFVGFLGASVTFPFLQAQRDRLGCDALCYGTMQSARSGLSMVGSVIIGRMSDKVGRSRVLFIGLAASIVSYFINLNGDSISLMWLAMIPNSLLNQNFNVLKALFADYNVENGGSESDRASSLGKLGMSIGIAFMLGPLIGTTFLGGYKETNIVALLLTIVSGGLLALLPAPKIKRTESTQSIESEVEKKAPPATGILSLLYLPAAQTKGARLLFFMRLSMGLAFNIFMTVWTVSLKQRFNFGPREHAFFMGWIGLCYALSQGLLAKMFIKMSGEDPTVVLLTCIIGLGFGRVIAMMTSSLIVVYAIMAGVIVALGVMNTAMAAACSHIAGADQVGGLFGILEAMESFSGLIGPTLGGVLYRAGPNIPLISVVAIYLIVFMAVYLFYKDTVVKMKPSKASKLA